MPTTLTPYRKKRNFKTSPEPRGAQSNIKRKTQGKSKTPSSRSLFVIQLHDASHLHYDLRLKIGSVLKSWAIPKGPSLNPNDKRLAVQTEDHPIEYAKFEGVIPEGHYGAGYVLVWDKGTFKNCTLSRTTQDKEKNKILDLEKAYKNGHIIFDVNGKKLHGKFVLQRFKNDAKPAWMLIKMKDEFSDGRKNIIKSRPESVLTGLTLKQMRNK